MPINFIHVFLNFHPFSKPLNEHTSLYTNTNMANILDLFDIPSDTICPGAPWSQSRVYARLKRPGYHEWYYPYASNNGGQQIYREIPSQPVKFEKFEIMNDYMQIVDIAGRRVASLNRDTATRSSLTARSKYHGPREIKMDPKL